MYKDLDVQCIILHANVVNAIQFPHIPYSVDHKATSVTAHSLDWE